MRRILTLTTFAAAAVLAACAAPAPQDPQLAYQPTIMVTSASFDVAWDAALAAAADAGVLVVRTDREGGRITGTKNGGALTIDLESQPDKSLKVTLSATAAVQSRRTLGEQWRAAYERRLAR